MADSAAVQPEATAGSACATVLAAAAAAAVEPVGTAARACDSVAVVGRRRSDLASAWATAAAIKSPVIAVYPCDSSSGVRGHRSEDDGVGSASVDDRDNSSSSIDSDSAGDRNSSSNNSSSSSIDSGSATDSSSRSSSSHSSNSSSDDPEDSSDDGWGATHPFDPGKDDADGSAHENDHSSSSSSSSDRAEDRSSSNDSHEELNETWCGPSNHPFDPGKRPSRSAGRVEALLGVEQPFDRGKPFGLVLGWWASELVLSDGLLEVESSASPPGRAFC